MRDAGGGGREDGRREEEGGGKRVYENVLQMKVRRKQRMAVSG